MRQKEWPNPWCATIQAGELLPPELAAGGPWLRAGGWPHSPPNSAPGPGVPGRARELTLGSTFSLQASLSPSGLTSFPGPRPHKPGLVHDKRWDTQTTTESGPEMKGGSGQEVDERGSGWQKSL